jgi:hypothetical protein
MKNITVADVERMRRLQDSVAGHDKYRMFNLSPIVKDDAVVWAAYVMNERAEMVAPKLPGPNVFHGKTPRMALMALLKAWELR